MVLSPVQGQDKTDVLAHQSGRELFVPLGPPEGNSGGRSEFNCSTHSADSDANLMWKQPHRPTQNNA